MLMLHNPSSADRFSIVFIMSIGISILGPRSQRLQIRATECSAKPSSSSSALANVCGGVGAAVTRRPGDAGPGVPGHGQKVPPTERRYRPETTGRTGVPRPEAASPRRRPALETDSHGQAEDAADAFYETLKDVYYAEKQSVKALKKSAKAAESEELKQAFETHAEESAKQVERLTRYSRSSASPPAPRPARRCRASPPRWRRTSRISATARRPTRFWSPAPRRSSTTRSPATAC